MSTLYLATILIIGFVIGIIIGKLRYGEGGKMFGKHVHNWMHLESSNGIDWFYCGGQGGCLAECCQSVNVDTGVIERQLFVESKKKVN